ncbi:MAG: sulfotransferase family protein [Cyanobacteria bacterium P01_G01_bin.39]
MNQSKIFVIGFQKTGTTSMGKALELLDYSVCGTIATRESSLETIRKKADSKLPFFDAFQDNPWCLLYKELDLKFPGSKFILTVRPTEKWISSMVNHFGYKQNPIENMIYGATSPIGNEDLYIETYERHNNEVMNYFKDRTEDLLLLQTGVDFSWSKICPFLDKDILTCDFPRLNVSKFPFKKIKPLVILKNFLIHR